jgi:hypothetical protein
MRRDKPFQRHMALLDLFGVKANSGYGAAGGINALVVRGPGSPCDRFNVHCHGHTRIGWNEDLLDCEFSSLWLRCE